MTPTPTRAAVARGVGRLAFDAVEELSRLVEAMHANIAAAPPPRGRATDGRARGTSGFVYDGVRLVNRAARAALDRGLALLPDRGGAAPGPRADALRSALNGVLGDHLAATGNPLAIPMQLRSGGRALPLERDALATALPARGGRILLLIHGLCMNDRQWTREGHDHGAALSRDLGITPVYLLYNSGRRVTENGRELAALLERLLEVWPAPAFELAILAHSMGGLVARSAVRHGAAAGHGWVRRLGRLVCLGTPHHGAPLERGGSWLEGALGASPYTAPLARLGGLRSAGITDLRHGDGAPLPAGVACYAVGGRIGPDPIGDGLVPLESALGRRLASELGRGFPEARRFVGRGLGHFALLDSPEVYARLRSWLA